MTIEIKDSVLCEAATRGVDDFIDAIAEAIKTGVGGELSSETMPKMSSYQITLLGYIALRDEVMEGGFIQLIYNGYGPFFFSNPFDTAIRRWGLIDLCRLMRHVKKTYRKHREYLECELSDDEFMALYERFPEFDDYDDEFVANEEKWTEMVGRFLDEHIDDFVTVIK